MHIPLSVMPSTTTSQPDRPVLSPSHTPFQMSFPPPPTTESRAADTKKSIPFALNFKSQSRSSSDSSSINSFNSQKVPRPILKKSIKSTKRTRQWILLSLLLLSFTILILSVIFAYCAALPHSDNIADAQASSMAAADGWNGPVTSTVSLISTSSTATAVPTDTPANNPRSIQGNMYSPRRLLTRDTPDKSAPHLTEAQIDDALARDAQNQSRFGTSGARTALTFYTATLPLLTILHTAIELLISLVRSETSQRTRLGDKFSFRNPNTSSSVTTTTLLQKRRTGTLLSFATSTLLVVGWLTIQIFTLNCEIVTFGHGGEKVCPVQIRGHHMGGVSELSVGKVVLGFLVVVGYVVYCVYLVRVVGVFGGKGSEMREGTRKVSGFRRRARFAQREEEQGKGKWEGKVERVSVSVVEVDEGLDKESGKRSDV